MFFSRARLILFCVVCPLADRGILLGVVLFVCSWSSGLSSRAGVGDRVGADGIAISLKILMNVARVATLVLAIAFSFFRVLAAIVAAVRCACCLPMTAPSSICRPRRWMEGSSWYRSPCISCVVS